MTIALTESLSMRRTTISLDQASLDWLTERHDADRISMSERLRALVTLARTDPAIADRAVETADQLRRAKKGSGGTPRTTVTLDEDSLGWLTAQIDRISMSERLRALATLARTDPAIADRAVEVADELRKPQRGGGP